MNYYLWHIFNSILNSFAIFLWEYERQACRKRPIFHLHNRCLQIEFEWDNMRAKSVSVYQGVFFRKQLPIIEIHRH